MRVPVGFTALVGWTAAISACGLSVTGLSDTESPVNDGGAAGRSDSGCARCALDASAGLDAPGSDGVVVPGGWTLVAAAPSQLQRCPPGFAATPPVDVFENPDVSAACGCGPCTVTAPPSCATGAVGVFFDVRTLGGSGCGLAGMPAQNANNPAGGCNTDLFHGDISAYDLRLAPPTATGGLCASPGVASMQSVTFGGADRTCAPDSAGSAGCTGNVCSPNLPAPYRACVVSPAPGAVCPADFPERHDVGTGVSLNCSSCACKPTATCTGTMTVYIDNACQDDALSIPADGACHPSNSPLGTTYGSYRYVGQASAVSCQAIGSSSAQNVQLTGAETICCPL
jgi:hypothetical protein